jgi:ribonuclease HI
MRADLVIDALQMAARNYTLADDAIFHSDSEYVWAGVPGLPDPRWTRQDAGARCSRAP